MAHEVQHLKFERSTLDALQNCLTALKELHEGESNKKLQAMYRAASEGAEVEAIVSPEYEARCLTMSSLIRACVNFALDNAQADELIARCIAAGKVRGHPFDEVPLVRPRSSKVVSSAPAEPTPVAADQSSTSTSTAAK